MFLVVCFLADYCSDFEQFFLVFCNGFVAFLFVVMV